MSQLDLAFAAEVSQRHVSFLESGRSNPSREVIEKLGDALDIPHAERSNLLLAAGFAPRQQRVAWSDEMQQAIDASLSYVMERHEPYPAMVVDRLWNLKSANRAAAQFLVRMGGRPEVNVIKALLSPECLRPRLVNYAVVGARLIGLIETEIARRLDDHEGQALLHELDSLLPDAERRHTGIETGAPVLGLNFRIDGNDLKIFSLIASVGFAQTSTLEELKLETMLPADQATRSWFATFQ